MSDFAEALKTRKASCGRAYIRETAKVAWDQVGGIDDVKAKIAKDVIAPNRYRQLAVKLGVRAPTGIIFHGPPGTGKTYLAKAIATQLGWTIISKRAAELVSKYLGETQRNIDDLFQAAIANAPVVVHIDEADSIAPKRVEGGDSASRERSSAVNTLLEGIDRIVEAQVPVLLIFTTNRIDILDDAFLRSGRVESHYYVGPPDQKGREEIFDLYGGNYATGKIDYHKLADVTEEFTPADIKWVWEEASRARFAASILKHESRSETSPFLKDLLEGKTPEAITEPHANIEVSPITMPDLLAAINLRTEKTERRS
jgi:transitional endoplasmic reticulum ATPase